MTTIEKNASNNLDDHKIRVGKVDHFKRLCEIFIIFINTYNPHMP